jgi:ubiquitin-like protein Pup
MANASKRTAAKPVGGETRESEGGVDARSLEQRGKDLKDAIDDLLDEIDDTLEENAEEFVRSYVQRGGQ